MLPERLLGGILELIAIVLERPAEVVIVVRPGVVLVLKIPAKPARLALDLARVAKVHEETERLLVADQIGTVDLGLELDFVDQVLVVRKHLACFVSLGMLADDLDSGFQVAELDRRLDLASAA